MKRLMLYICAFCIVSTAFAQRYDYDDIYFNPKKDIQKSTENRVQSTDDIEQMIDSSQFSIILYRAYQYVPSH